MNSANAKKWEVELQTLKSNNARLTGALQESTANVEEWKRQLQALKEENTKMKSRCSRKEAYKQLNTNRGFICLHLTKPLRKNNITGLHNMEVLNEYAALLSNAEVLSILESFKKDLKEPKYIRQNVNDMSRQLSDKEKNLQSLNTVVYETIKHLEETPCVAQNQEHIKNFMTAISSYNLTKGEKIQILNLRPTSLVQIQLLIEESEERFTEDQLNEILTIVTETLPPGPEAENTPPMEADFDENG